jgi:hypothetical protein
VYVSLLYAADASEPRRARARCDGASVDGRNRVHSGSC